jgi:hypothetical protein
MDVKDLRPQKVKDIYKTLESLILMTDTVDDLTMLAVVMFISARQTMITAQGTEKTIEVLNQLAEEITLGKAKKPKEITKK